MTTTRRTILICDDTEAIRRLVRATLEPGGHAFVEASNGRDALDAIETFRPDLVVLDLRMPEMGGMEVLTRLAASVVSRPRILVLTSEVLDAGTEAVILRHADMLFYKPFRPTELRLGVQGLLSDQLGGRSFDSDEPDGSGSP